MIISDELEQFRLPDAPLVSTTGMPFGMFKIAGLDVTLVSNDPNWEHVTVSTPHRCPAWVEMCEIKRMVWGKNETVIQYHPKEEEYVNLHPYALHLWRHTMGHELPDLRMVYSGRTEIPRMQERYPEPIEEEEHPWDKLTIVE